MQPKIYVRMCGPSTETSPAVSALEGAGFEPRRLEQRSANRRAWIEIEAAGSIGELEGIRQRAEQVLDRARCGFTVREYGPSPTVPTRWPSTERARASTRAEP